jgi:hypothetical protein
MSGQLQPPDRFTPGDRARGTPSKGGWVGPRAGLDTAEKRKISGPPPGNESIFLGYPAHSMVTTRTEFLGICVLDK